MESLTQKTEPVIATDIYSLMDSARSFLFPNFPIFDEAHRTDLENRIMERFMFREIALTPYARWQFLFNNKMMVMMPKYNQLYKVMSQDFNLFDDTNYKRTVDEDTVNNGTKNQKDNSSINSTNETETNGTATTTDMPGVTTLETHNTTPQTALQDFIDNKYLNSADKTSQSGQNVQDVISDSKDTQTLTSSSEATRNENSSNNLDRNLTEQITGKRSGRTYAELLAEYQQSLRTVDEMILDELEEMFFCLYD